MLDRKYYRRRERDHRAMASAETYDAARNVHLTLADHYAANLKDETGGLMTSEAAARSRPRQLTVPLI